MFFIGSSVICEDHFATSCFQRKNKRVWLKKDAIPTLIHRQYNGIVEKFEIRFNEATNTYDENDFAFVNAIKSSTEERKAMIKRRQEKIDELKSVCRFCITGTSESAKLVQITKLEAYSINLNELAVFLGLDMNKLELFSDVVCEQCFHLIVEIDNFRKKCQEIQKEVLEEFSILDKQISDMSKEFPENELFEEYNEEVLIDNLQKPLDTSMEIIEEHLIDEQDELMDDEFELGEEIPLDQIEYIEEIPFTDEQNIKNDEAVLEDEVIVTVASVDMNLSQQASLEKSRESLVQGVDEYEDVSVDDIIKNPERNRFCFKIFECFFCKMVSMCCIDIKFHEIKN